MEYKNKKDKDLINDPNGISASIEMMRRLKDVMEKSAKESRHNSKVSTGLSMIIFLVAILQLFMFIESVSEGHFQKLFLIIFAFGILLWGAWAIKKEIYRKD